jgi:hypothetical protein
MSDDGIVIFTVIILFILCEELVTSTDSVLAKFVVYDLKVSNCLHILIIDLDTIFDKFLYDQFPYQIHLLISVVR